MVIPPPAQGTHGVSPRADPKGTGRGGLQVAIVADVNLRTVVDDKPIDPRRLWCSHMSLSSARPQVDPSPYVLEMPASEFAALLGPLVAQYADELKRDQEEHGWSDRWSDAGFPVLPELLKDPELCGDVVGSYFLTELLCVVLPWGNTGPGSYVVDTIERVCEEGDSVVITGQCIRIPSDDASR
jgi:hypothetical protein